MSSQGDTPLELWQRVLAASGAGLISTLLVNPLDVVKVSHCVLAPELKLSKGSSAVYWDGPKALLSHCRDVPSTMPSIV